MSNRNTGVENAYKKKRRWIGFTVTAIVVGIILYITWMSTDHILKGFGHAINALAMGGVWLCFVCTIYGVIRSKVAIGLYDCEKNWREARDSFDDEKKAQVRKRLKTRRNFDSLLGGHWSVIKSAKGHERFMLIALLCAGIIVTGFILRLFLLKYSATHASIKVVCTIVKAVLIITFFVGLYCFVRALIKSLIDQRVSKKATAYTEARFKQDLADTIKQIERERIQENRLKPRRKRKLRSELKVTADERKKIAARLRHQHSSDCNRHGYPWDRDDIFEMTESINSLKKWDRRLSLGISWLK